MFSASKNWVGICCVGLALSQIVGCGGDSSGKGRTAAIYGKVTYKGAPVEEGTVQISDGAIGAGGTGVIGPGGTYEIKELLAGNYKVTVQPVNVEDKGNGKTSPRMVPKVVANIPPKYRSEKTSGFTAVLNEGQRLETNLSME